MLLRAERRGQKRAVRGRAGRDARRRPRHLSLCHVLDHHRRRRRRRHRRRARGGCTTCSASSRPMRRASAPARFRPNFSTSTASTCARGPRVRLGHRPARGAAAGSTRRRCGARSCTTAVSACASPSSTCSMAWIPSASASATGSTAHQRLRRRCCPRTSATAKPVYEDMPGWKRIHRRRHATTRSCPPTRRSYLDRLQAPGGVPIAIISTGPDRGQTIIRRNLFD